MRLDADGRPPFPLCPVVDGRRTRVRACAPGGRPDSGSRRLSSRRRRTDSASPHSRSSLPFRVGTSVPSTPATPEASHVASSGMTLSRGSDAQRMADRGGPSA